MTNKNEMPELLQILGGKIQQACPDWQTNKHAQDAFELVRQLKVLTDTLPSREDIDKALEDLEESNYQLGQRIAKGYIVNTEQIENCDKARKKLKTLTAMKGGDAE